MSQAQSALQGRLRTGLAVPDAAIAGRGGKPVCWVSKRPLTTADGLFTTDGEAVEFLRRALV